MPGILQVPSLDSLLNSVLCDKCGKVCLAEEASESSLFGEHHPQCFSVHCTNICKMYIQDLCIVCVYCMYIDTL